MILRLFPLEHVIDSWQRDPPCNKIHAIEFLNHVLLDPSSLCQHLLSQVQGLPSTWNVKDSQHKAFIIYFVSNFSFFLALFAIENLRYLEGVHI